MARHKTYWTTSTRGANPDLIDIPMDDSSMIWLTMESDAGEHVMVVEISIDADRPDDIPVLHIEQWLSVEKYENGHAPDRHMAFVNGDYTVV